MKPFKFFSLRIPVDLHQWLKLHASSNRRSMNNELIRIVEKYKASTEAEG